MLELLNRRRRVLGVDVGTAFVKALALEQLETGTVVAGCGIAEVEGENRIDALKQALAACGSTSGRVVTSVSGRSVTVRYITMERMSDEDLKSRLPLEADKYMPYDVNELFLDGQRLDIPAGENEMRVLLVSAKKTLVQEQIALLQQAGVNPNVMDVDSFALGNAYELVHALPGAPEGKPIVALVDIGATKTNINILKKSISCFTREVYVGGRDLTEVISKKLGVSPSEAEQLKRDPADRAQNVAEAVTQIVEDLGNEIRLSFDYFESQFEEEVQQVSLSGGGARMQGLSDILRSTFGKETQMWDPSQGLTAGPGVNLSILADHAPQFAIALGLAARIGTPA